MSSKILLLFLFVLVLGCSEDEKPDFPEISIFDLEISEGSDSKVVFIDLFLSQKFDQPITVVVSTLDETAKDGTDYIGIQNHQVIFEPNDVVKSVSITLLGDEIFEQNETFLVEIVSAENATILESNATVTIINDDTGGLSLIWSDEFDQFDLSKWTYEIGGTGWGNNELQYYTDKNVSIVNGNLIIEARKENEGGREYTSSRIITKDKYEFQNGRVDIRAILPKGQGIWPALWMLGANISEVGWPACGEIDIMEMIGGSNRENTVHGTIHWSNNSGVRSLSGESYTLSSGTFADDFHIFSIIWDDNSIKWYVDDEFSHEIAITEEDQTEFNENFFFIFNVAVGGDWPGNPDGTSQYPQQMIVDYIRVYQAN